MAKIDFVANFKDNGIAAKLAEIEAKAKKTSDAFKGFNNSATHTFKDIKGFQKTIKDAEKLNKILNDSEKTVTKFGKANEKAFDGLTNKIMKSVTAVGLLMKGISMIGSGIGMAKDFAVDSYTKALELNQEKAALRSSYSGKPGSDRLMDSMDELSHKLLRYGIPMAETFKSAKMYSNLYPGANQAAAENFVNASAALARSNFHGDMEQGASSLKLLETAIEIGNKPGIRQLVRTLFPTIETNEIVAELVKKKKGKGGRSKDDIINDISRITINRLGAQALDMVNQDPLSYFKYKLEEASNTLGQTLLTTFKTPGIQNLFTSIVNKFDEMIKNITPEKISNVIQTVVGAFNSLVGAITSVVEFITDHLGKSDWQKEQERKGLKEFFSEVGDFQRGDKIVIDKNTGLPTERAKSPQEMYEYAFPGKLRGKNLEYQYDYVQTLLDKFTKNGYSGLSGVDPKVIQLVEYLSTNYKQGKLNIPQSKNPSGAERLKYQEGGNSGVPEKAPFTVTNETSSVTGNRPVVININIDKQIETLNIDGGASSLSETSTSQLREQIISVLDDALMSSESIMGSM